MTLELRIPDSVTKVVRLPEKEMEGELLIELAVTLCARGTLSFGKARDLADLSHYAFAHLY